MYLKHKVTTHSMSHTTKFLWLKRESKGPWHTGAVAVPISHYHADHRMPGVDEFSVGMYERSILIESSPDCSNLKHATKTICL